MKMSEYIDTLSLKIAEDFAYRLKSLIVIHHYPLSFKDFLIFEDLSSLYGKEISFLTSKNDISLSLCYKVGIKFFYKIAVNNDLYKELANKIYNYLSSLDFHRLYKENSAQNYINAFELIEDTIME